MFDQFETGEPETGEPETAECDPLALVREGLDGLTGEDRSGWPSWALSSLLVELVQTAERVQAEVVRLTGEWDAVQAWAADGAVSAPGWLAARTPLPRDAGARLVRSARLAQRYERTGKALAAGDISVSHVELMAKAERHRSSVFAAHESMLLDIAPTLNPADFATAMAHWRSAADDQLATPDPTKKYRHQYLELRPTFDGHSAVDGFLDSDSAAWLRAALDAVDSGNQPDESAPRTQAERYADALVELAKESLAHSTRGGRRQPNVDALLDLNAILGPAPTDLLGSHHEIDGRPASLATLERLCCDANIGRVIMRGKSEVLDIGRRSRTPTAAQFRALIVRDRHCRFPGCDRPPEWTDVHHLQHWLHGGSTDLDNLVLLCRRHHVLCHEGGWALRREPDGTITAIPPQPSDRPSPPRRGPPYALAA